MRLLVRHANIREGSRRLGLIVNPIAGMGGPAGQKGTDEASALARARALGVRPLAAERAGRALAKLLPLAGELSVLAAAGSMGADLSRELGFTTTTVGPEAQAAMIEGTRAEDTREAAAAMAGAGLDLLLFAGGDGTARDILSVAPDLPVLGVPTGVKMHSAVFAASPDAAGHVAAGVLREPSAARWRQAEVMDIDEDLLRAGHVAARLFGYARSPDDRRRMQNCKSRGDASDDAALDALAARLSAAMDPATVYVLGCGETMRRIKRRLGGEGTLLGVDLALGGRLIATDVDEARLLRLTEGAPTRVIVSVTGGQGFVFGRGNQQISARLLARIGRDAVTIVTSQRKLTGLDPSCLRVDTGDPAVDAIFSGYMRVETAPGRSMIMQVAA
jgi:predicted polyphosphate/ATP-dependent NAD kinase